MVGRAVMQRFATPYTVKRAKVRILHLPPKGSWEQGHSCFVSTGALVRRRRWYAAEPKFTSGISVAVTRRSYMPLEESSILSSPTKEGIRLDEELVLKTSTGSDPSLQSASLWPSSNLRGSGVTEALVAPTHSMRVRILPPVPRLRIEEVKKVATLLTSVRVAPQSPVTRSYNGSTPAPQAGRQEFESPTRYHGSFV